MFCKFVILGESSEFYFVSLFVGDWSIIFFFWWYLFRSPKPCWEVLFLPVFWGVFRGLIAISKHDCRAVLRVLCVLSRFSLCLSLCELMDCSPSGSSVHGILQARILEWVAMPSSRRPSWPRDHTHISCLLHWQADSLPLVPLGSVLASCFLRGFQRGNNNL